MWAATLLPSHLRLKSIQATFTPVVSTRPRTAHNYSTNTSFILAAIAASFHFAVYLGQFVHTAEPQPRVVK